METQLKSNLGSRKTWLRGLYMVLFAVIYSVTEVVIGAVVILQFLFTLVTGQTNARLLCLSDHALFSLQQRRLAVSFQ